MKARDYKAAHFLWSVDDDGVATLTLNRPERLNALAPLHDLMSVLADVRDRAGVKVLAALKASAGD